MCNPSKIYNTTANWGGKYLAFEICTQHQRSDYKLLYTSQLQSFLASFMSQTQKLNKECTFNPSQIELIEITVFLKHAYSC